MKRIRIENGKLTAYIEPSDVETLINTREVVPITFFDEEMVKRGYGDENGIYRISELSSVNYIKTASFIPNKDYFDKLSASEIESIYDRAVMDRESLTEILKKLYSKECLTAEEKRILEESEALKTSPVGEVQEKAFVEDDVAQEARFIILSEVLVLQSNHYIESVDAYLENRKEKEKPKTKSKKFSVKSLFERNKH